MCNKAHRLEAAEEGARPGAPASHPHQRADPGPPSPLISSPGLQGLCGHQRGLEAGPGPAENTAPHLPWVVSGSAGGTSWTVPTAQQLQALEAAVALPQADMPPL